MKKRSDHHPIQTPHQEHAVSAAKVLLRRLRRQDPLDVCEALGYQHDKQNDDDRRNLMQSTRILLLTEEYLKLVDTPKETPKRKKAEKKEVVEEEPIVEEPIVEPEKPAKQGTLNMIDLDNAAMLLMSDDSEDEDDEISESSEEDLSSLLSAMDGLGVGSTDADEPEAQSAPLDQEAEDPFAALASLGDDVADQTSETDSEEDDPFAALSALTEDDESNIEVAKDDESEDPFAALSMLANDETEDISGQDSDDLDISEDPMAALSQLGPEETSSDNTQEVDIVPEEDPFAALASLGDDVTQTDASVDLEDITLDISENATVLEIEAENAPLGDPDASHGVPHAEEDASKIEIDFGDAEDDQISNETSEDSLANLEMLNELEILPPKEIEFSDLELLDAEEDEDETDEDEVQNASTEHPTSKPEATKEDDAMAFLTGSFDELETSSDDNKE